MTRKRRGIQALGRIAFILCGLKKRELARKETLRVLREKPKGRVLLASTQSMGV